MATTQTNQKPSAPTSRLGSVKGGVIYAPKRYFFYGADGTGKTTLAADAPEAIFADIEGGSEEQDIKRYMFWDDDEEGFKPRSYEDVLFMINDLTTAAHSYKTLVLDTVDCLEPLLWAWMIKRDNDPSVMTRKNPLNQVEDYGYGVGYDRAVDVWRDLCGRLDRLRAHRKMEIVMLAHAKIMNFKNPEGENYDRWVPALNAKAAGFLKGWANIVGRICHEETTKKDGRAAKGISTGVHVLKLAHSAAFDAKGRGSLPAEIEIPIESPWAPLREAIEAGYETDIKKLTSEIDAETARIGDDGLTARVSSAVKEAVGKKDTQSLKAYLNSLKTRPAKVAEAQQ